MLEQLYQKWSFKAHQALAQFAPPDLGDKRGGSATEIVPNADEVVGDLLGTKTEGGFFTVMGDILALLVTYLLGIVGFVAVLALVYAGFLWVTAAANPDNINKAKSVLKYVVIGLLLAGFAYAIVRSLTYVGTLTG